MPSGSASRCSPFWLRRIELEEGKRQFAAALDAVPERTTAACRGAAGRGIDRLPQRHDRARHRRWPRAPRGSRSRSETESTSGVRCSSSASSGSRATLPTSPCPGSSRRSSSRDERASPRPRRSGSTRSGSRSGSSATSRAPTSSCSRASNGSARSKARPTRSRRRSTSPRSGRRSLEGQIAVRHVFEDTLQPLVEISCDAAIGYALANQAGSLASEAISTVHGRCSTRAPRASTHAGDDAGLATVLVRRAHLALAEDELSEARAHLEAALELRDGLSDRRGRGLVLSGLGARRDGGRRLRRGRDAPRRGTRHLQARRRSVGSREHAVARGRPRPRARPARRGGGGAAGGPLRARRDPARSAGSGAPSSGSREIARAARRHRAGNRAARRRTRTLRRARRRARRRGGRRAASQHSAKRPLSRAKEGRRHSPESQVEKGKQHHE